ncbi:MAG: 40S ribosomal protein S19 [Candidatus Poseidoniaceae archaeon]|nr:40S ribosomal protein S19 [Candidatus Poseidoniaceae archaeon]MBL6895807.1 40S ribosomal protein S19 [Candidatus Poseidoniaceae archaeon]MDA8545331.1 40S ribosomal protein S19 [Candidatus Poseidoniales archaeon]MDC3245366.1 40S ribosomal protein S19 [bacterium]
MTTYFDIPANMLISALADKLSDSKDIVAPDWSEYVKTGVDRERPPTQENWWTIRAASLLRKVAKQGPVGVTTLAQTYGTVMNNGAGPNTPGVASRHIIRTALQQLEVAGLVEMVATREVDTEDGKQQLYSGRRLTSAGQKLLDEVAHSCRDAANEMYPGLAKY